MYISDLLDRYQLSHRKSLYPRLKALDIVLPKKNKKSYATPEQIALLDKQHEHIKNGGSIKDFTPVAEVTVEVTGESSMKPILRDKQVTYEDTIQATPHVTITPDFLVDLLQLAGVAQQQSPLWYREELEKAIVHEWLLTTTDIEQLIGVKPRLKKGQTVYRRGSFLFVKCGKIGNQTAWQVRKIIG